ncbi:MAG: beta-propeller fold lactonase family protein, partial [Planctomycetota bacterium]
MRFLFALFPVLALAATGGAQPSYANYESPHVHPVRLSADGSRLFAVNTPDGRLAVFSLANPSSPLLLGEIPVGLEPVSVAPRTADEVWVANHLGDSVSVVSVSQGTVLDTIPCADEPADVVFAGSPPRAFVAVSASNEVRVFDVATHALLQTLPIFGKDPRALAVSADGSKVWVAVTESGNGTTVLLTSQSPPQDPPTNPALPSPPQVARIVASTDPAYASLIPYTLPDSDVVEIDANTGGILASYPGVGTVNFGLAPRPGTDELWVANTEARNLVFFEPALRGHAVDNRVTRIVTGPAPSVSPIDLNPGIDFGLLPNPAALSTSLAQPVDLAWDPAGATLYVAAFGTDRIGVLDPTGAVVDRIEIGPASGAAADPRNKKGPRGLAHHPAQPRLYVLNRISQTLQTIDTVSRTVLSERALAASDPEPWFVREGRGFLYDAKLSGNGTMACASCHIDSNLDGLAWDLGEAGGSMQFVPNPFNPLPALIPSGYLMHPMKGPMTTQSLKGLSATTPFHWRGDRADFAAFNAAFGSLLGASPIAAGDMVDYAAFVATILYPPNPNRALDDTLPATLLGGDPAAGQTFFQSSSFIPVNPTLTCAVCHALPVGTSRTIAPGSFLQQSQSFKVPHLRNLYEKIGFERAPGPQRSGFGFRHDGEVDTILTFLQQPLFQTLAANTPAAAANRQNLQAFLLSFDTGTKPAVGYGRTVTQANATSASVDADFTLLSAQRAAGACDLVAKGVADGEPRGWVYSGGTFLPDLAALPPLSWTDMQNAAVAGTSTFTLIGVPVGSGQRIGIDRDLDGVLDGDEAPQSYGASTPGCSGPLALRANSEPRVGSLLFALSCTGFPPGSLGLVGFSASAASAPMLGVTVLLDLTAGAFFLTIPADGAGVAARALPIPNDPLLVGGAIFAQAFSIDPCGLQGLGASQG